MDQRGGATDLGAPVRLWTYDDYDDEGVVEFTQDKFYELSFWIDKKATKKGGDDIHNDCLFNTINWLSNRNLPEKFNTAEKFKTALKLKRDNKVSIDYMPNVEKMMKVNINVTGDHTYISQKYYTRTINIQLIAGHFECVIDTDKKKELHIGYEYMAKKLVAVKIIDGEVTLYQGKQKEFIKMDYINFKKYKEDNRDNKIFYEVSNKGDIIKEYQQYVADAKEIKKMTNNDINLFKSSAIHKHGKALFYKLSNNTLEADSIDQLEASYLKIKAGIISSIPGTYDNIYEYDVNTMYGSLLCKNMYPVKKGEFTTLKNLPEKLEYGMYKCIISGDSKLFRLNDNNLYTQYDIMNARMLGLEIQLMDVPNNALIYTKDKLEYGSRLFKPTIDYLYDLKQKVSENAQKRVKSIISSFWGSLCEVTEKKFTISIDEEFEAHKGSFINHIYRIGNNIRVTTASNNQPFATKYARIGVFLTSQSRYFISRTALPHIDHIKRIHTDSILSTKEIPEIKITSNIGDWKLKKYSKAIIKNSNSKPLFYS
jgi:hypothetical protein